MTRIIALILSVIVFTVLLVAALSAYQSSRSAPPPKPAPMFPYSQNQSLPSISAAHVFIIDVNSGAVLYTKAADEQVYPASITKMMTALVIHKQFASDQAVTISSEFKEGQHLGFHPGESVTVERLLYALLVQSANDAAEVLAAAYPGGRSAFIDAMNREATELHLGNTRFKNPHGLDEEGHFSTAADLTRLSIKLMENPKLAHIVSTENAVIASEGYSDLYVLNNVNQLLGKVPGVLGIKTGYTDKAGQSLVTWVERDGHPVVITVLGSKDRFADSRELVEWVYRNFNWQPLDPNNLPELPVRTP